MIQVNEAFAILENNLPTKSIQTLPLLQAHQHVLAEDFLSPIHMPPFRQSAMDGFALCLHENLSYTIIGEIKAGDAANSILKPGEAVKIFTGAQVPDTAQAVIPIEKVTVQNQQLQINQQVAQNANIRPIGEQIKKDALALPKGTKLNAASIGFLAGLGCQEVKVYQKLSIGIVITGNELMPAGQPLAPGKVYESNAIMLETALHEANFTKNTRYNVQDDFENTKKTLQKALQQNDIVLVSGGISVGDYDFVARVLAELQVKTLFHKINQKPGKPLFAGKKESKLVFALPGNPAAALTCFYVYVLPTLKNCSGEQSSYQSSKKKQLLHDFEVNNSRSQFLKAKISENNVEILTHQASSMLHSFAHANALVYLPHGNYSLPKGTEVVVFLL